MASSAFSAKKKKGNEEEETQALQLPKELPAAVEGETRRLAFFVTPLSARGLLSQQVRDALRNLEHQAGGNPILHLRAFVAGTGDPRRVRELVSEIFTERHQPLPALSLIQVGALPLAGAQVEIEGIANGKRDVQQAVVFAASPAASSEDPQDPVAPLLEKALAGMHAAPADVLRVTCFFSSVDNAERLKQRIRMEYPRAGVTVVQAQRAPQHAVASCEAAAGMQAVSAGVPGAITAPRAVFTGTQVAFGYEEQDARLAFERLGKDLESAGASFSNVAFAHFYPLSPRMEDRVRQQIPAFFKQPGPPALMVQIEGLPASDAGFAVDAIAGKAPAQ